MSLMPYLLGAALVAAPAVPSELPSPVVPDGLGVNIHFTGAPARDLDMLQAGGFRFIRMDFTWSRIEREKGVYDFKPYDELTEGLAQRGIRALYILDYSNNLYEKERSVRTEEGRQAFARFAAAAAERYRGKGILWELWNEPNISFWQPQPSVDDYMALAKAVFPAIRKADPQALRAAPATSGVPLDFLEGCFRRGLLDLVDTVTVHPYRQSPPETAAVDIQRLRALIARYRPDRPDLPVISGEWGYSAVWGNFDEARQGRYLPRQFLSNLSLGIPLSIWYDWHDDGRDPKEPEHHFGTVTIDRAPKPAYLAMQRLVAALKGMRFIKRLESKPEDYLLLFAEGQRRVLAVWTTGEAHEAEPIPGQKVQLTEDPQYLPVPADARSVLAEGAWTVSQRSVGVRGGAKAGDPLAPVFRVAVNNPFERPVQVRLEAEAGEGLAGSFAGETQLTLGPGARKEAAWSGTAVRCEEGQAAVTVAATVDGLGSRQQVSFLLTNSLAVEVLPADQQGVAVAIRNPSGDAFRGDLEVSSGQDKRTYSLELKMNGDAELRPAAPIPPNPPSPRGRGAEGIGPAPKVSVVDETVRMVFPGAMGADGVRVVLKEAGQVVADSGRVRFMPLEVTTQTARTFNDGDAKVTAKSEMTDVALNEPDAPAERGVRLVYDFAKGWRFVRIFPAKAHPIEGEPRAISVWVRGDGSGNLLRLRYVDKNGRTFQPDFGRLDFTGWRQLTARMDNPHVGKWGGEGDPNKIVPPLRLDTFILVDGRKEETKGDVTFADFRLIHHERE